MIDAANLGAVAVTAPLVGYLATLTTAACWARATNRGASSIDEPPTTRFAVVIPAHDEEALIGGTVRALCASDYPIELFTIHVVADHCGDGTVERARSAGAVVHEHDNPRPAGKGVALDWIIAELDVGAGDVTVIVDADTTVEPGFLRALDARFREGASVVQGYYAVQDPDSSHATALRSWALALRHYVRPLGRVAIGGSSGLYGNGMAFRREVLRGCSWGDHLTEDLQLQTELLLDGTLVDFAPDARIHAEMPASLLAATSRNERWERGRSELARRYVPRLARAASGPSGRGRRIALVDTMFDHLVPPLSVLAVAVAGSATLSSAAHVIRPNPFRRAMHRSSLLVMGLLTVHALTGPALAGSPFRLSSVVTAIPRSILWKTRLWARTTSGLGASVTWVRTERNQPTEAD